MLVSAVSLWVTTLRMRRRLKRALGRTAKGAELLSIRTWIEVDEAEKRKPLG
jgi:hypothetical protein